MDKQQNRQKFIGLTAEKNLSFVSAVPVLYGPRH